MELKNRIRRKSTNLFLGPGGGLEVLGIAIPLFISQASETVMLFTDRLFLSKLGPEQMSAAMGGGTVSFLAVTFFIGLIGYSTAMVAQRFGANQSEKCAVITTQALAISFLAYPIIIAFIPLGKILFTKAGISPEQLKYQIPYFQIIMFGNITVLLRNSLSCFFSGIGKTRVIMVANVACMILNVGINYLLVFGKLGFPQLGVRGAAYGTIISGLASLMILVVAYFHKNNVHKYDVLKSFHLKKGLFKELFHFGYPAGLELFFGQIGFALMIIA
ncbi:MAG: MATE family efflux transporter, partial [Fibrobacter sp.]|nr:MATE family efflux transporter [Fibrobacter sp.]